MERAGFEDGMTLGEAQVLMLSRHPMLVQHFQSKDHSAKPSSKFAHCAGTRPIICIETFKASSLNQVRSQNPID